MESQHMTQQGFAQFLGMSAAILSSIFNGRTKPTLNTVDAIKSKIPNINTDWLIFGKGEMYNTLSDSPITAPTNTTSSEETALDFSSSDPEPLFSDLSTTPLQQVNERPRREVVRQEVKFVDKPQRKITEIKIYFDDSTYETFEPKK
jgi:transcriptional regulator with XRE-family HTH domain